MNNKLRDDFEYHDFSFEPMPKLYLVRKIGPIFDG